MAGDPLRGEETGTETNKGRRANDDRGRDLEGCSCQPRKATDGSSTRSWKRRPQSILNFHTKLIGSVIS